MIAALLLASWFSAPLPSAPAQLPPPRPPIDIPADAVHFNGAWYRLYLEPVTWKRARERCTALGGQLVVVPDAPTHAFVKALAKDLAVWLGATDEEVEGLWRWTDGSEMAFKSWTGREPRGGRRENYLLMHKGGWEDYPNETRIIAGFICQWTRN